MKIDAYPCDLCGQPVKVNGFTASSKRFCCAGCLSIYRLLNPESLSTSTMEETS